MAAERNNVRRQGSPPRPPDVMAPDRCARIDAADLVSSARHDDAVITGVMPVHRACGSIVLTGSYGSGISGCSAKLPGLNARDCKFMSCDFSNADWADARLKRCHVEACRFTGLWGVGMTLEDVRFIGCTFHLAVLHRLVLESVVFEDCTLREADLEGADLRGGVFRGCDLGGAHFAGAKLDGTDLRRSSLVGVTAGADAMRGAIVEPTQAMDLLHIFGLDVRNAGDLAS